jgi:hypothetical protein
MPVLRAYYESVKGEEVWVMKLLSVAIDVYISV